jgi:hypothetical protein
MQNPELMTLNIPNVNIDLRERIATAAKAEGRSVASEVRMLLNRAYPASAPSQQ